MTESTRKLKMNNIQRYVAVLLVVATTSIYASEPNNPPSVENQQTESWTNRVSDSLRLWMDKIPEIPNNIERYSSELQNKWPDIKNKFQQEWNTEINKGKEINENFQTWLSSTLSSQEVEKAENWLKNFKEGTKETIIDPLVPYLLSLRYANPLDEWQEGYRRSYSVLLDKDHAPLQITLPLSWTIDAKSQSQKNQLLCWKNENGSGNLSLSLSEFKNKDDVVNFIEYASEKYPSVQINQIPETEIQRILFSPDSNGKEIIRHYIIPYRNSFIVLKTQQDLTKNQSDTSIEKISSFFDTVAKNIS